MVSKEQIQNIAADARPENVQTHLNCRPINEQIQKALAQEGFECEVVDGRMTRYELRGEGPEHSFILVTDDSIEGDSPVIVDGAIEQFCRENKSKGYVFFSLGKREDLPSIAVVANGDELYEKYSW